MPETPSKREWIIEPAYDHATGQLVADIESQVSYRLSQLAVVICTIGGTVAVVPEREERERVLNDEKVTRDWVLARVIIRWESFSPARRLPREEPAPESPPLVAESNGHVGDEEPVAAATA